MARDFARVSAMEGMMWFGFVHCRRSFLRQGMGFKAWAPPGVHTCARAMKRDFKFRARCADAVEQQSSERVIHLSHEPHPSEKRPFASDALTVKSARETSPLRARKVNNRNPVEIDNRHARCVRCGQPHLSS